MAQKLFASLDKNGIVENCSTINYSHSIMEYSADQSITNNQPQIGATYDAELNVFIPPKPDETYIWNMAEYAWDPDPNREYTINNIVCRWSPKLRNFILPENWSDAEHL